MAKTTRSVEELETQVRTICTQFEAALVAGSAERVRATLDALEALVAAPPPKA